MKQRLHVAQPTLLQPFYVVFIQPHEKHGKTQLSLLEDVSLLAQLVFVHSAWALRCLHVADQEAEMIARLDEVSLVTCRWCVNDSLANGIIGEQAQPSRRTCGRVEPQY